MELPYSRLESQTDYESLRDFITTSAAEYLNDEHERIQQVNLNGASGQTVVDELSAMFDNLNRFLYQAACIGLDENGVAGCALLALGGYGRAEMNPRSDLDLMFFYLPQGEEAAKTISDRMLYQLWDLKLDVGYSVRSASECIKQSIDSTVRTAQLDARLLVGKEEVFESFQQKVGKYVLNHDTQSFINQKLKENEIREKKYGSSVYLLEPNIKEGEGGLRELQTALWIARVKFKASGLRELLYKGVLSESEIDEYRQAQNYLWKIRNHLHFTAQRKTDQLTFELQQQIARQLKFKD
ncbi:MAG: [protein-PII] uridylyltransferase, partial [Desulfuromonas sp.]